MTTELSHLPDELLIAIIHQMPPTTQLMAHKMNVRFRNLVVEHQKKSDASKKAYKSVSTGDLFKLAAGVGDVGVMQWLFDDKSGCSGTVRRRWYLSSLARDAAKEAIRGGGGGDYDENVEKRGDEYNIAAYDSSFQRQDADRQRYRVYSADVLGVLGVLGVLMWLNDKFDIFRRRLIRIAAHGLGQCVYS